MNLQEGIWHLNPQHISTTSASKMKRFSLIWKNQLQFLHKAGYSDNNYLFDHDFPLGLHIDTIVGINCILNDLLQFCVRSVK